MKKLISILSAAAMLAGMTTMTSFAADKAAIGDINKDGKVDFDDEYAALQNYAEAIAEGKDAPEDADSDVDGDGVITSIDATFIHYFVISRDYGSNIELSKENLEAIVADAAKAINENTLVFEQEGSKISVKSDPKAYISQNIRYLGSYGDVRPAVVFDSLGRTYEVKNDEGGYDVYLLSDTFEFGDVNLDGKVDSTDATEILKGYAFALNEGTWRTDSVEEYIRSDYNKDGSMNSSDATGVLVAYAETLNK